MRKDLGISRLCNFWKPADPPETLWNLEPPHRAVTQKTLCFCGQHEAGALG
jgi:hypothetical protein